MRGAVTPLPQYVFLAWCLVKQRDNCTFYLYYYYYYYYRIMPYVCYTLRFEAGDSQVLRNVTNHPVTASFRDRRESVRTLCSKDRCRVP